MNDQDNNTSPTGPEDRSPRDGQPGAGDASETGADLGNAGVGGGASEAGAGGAEVERAAVEGDASTTPMEASRSASVRLRRASDDDPRSMVEAANQSLADALRISFRVLVVLMVGLVGAFLFSGFQSVNEGERGIALLFGRPVGAEVDPGFRFSPPYPFGELVTVDVTQQRLELSREFMPATARAASADLSFDRFVTKQTLEIRQDDRYLVTADENIAHTRWSVPYRRSDATQFAQKLSPEDPDGEGRRLSDEAKLLRAVVMRAIVIATAETEIDPLLKDAPTDPDSVAARATQIAEAHLDSLDVGLSLEGLMTLQNRYPPRAAFDAFQRVQSASADAQRERVEAEKYASDVLEGLAGSAAPLLISLIEDYEAALALDNASEAERIQAEIDSVLMGDAVEYDGRVVRVSGAVSSLIANARSRRAAIVSEARADALEFEAMQEAYRANPRLAIQSAWRDRYTVFMDSPRTELFQVPAGSELFLVLNRDREVIDEFIKAQNEARLAETIERRLDMMEEGRPTLVEPEGGRP